MAAAVGGRNRPNFRDPAFQEAMKKYMEQPEVKAKMEEIRPRARRSRSSSRLEVNRVLGKRQAALYKKMLGAPFDLAVLRGGPGGRGPGNRNGNQANASKTATKAQASGSDEEDSETAKPAAKAVKAATAKPKRKSLRELRGLDE